MRKLLLALFILLMLCPTSCGNTGKKELNAAIRNAFNLRSKKRHKTPYKLIPIPVYIDRLKDIA
jgi:hypothetical protein